jgi:cell division protein ZapA
MAEVTLSINGRNYGISCDNGQEQRVRELGRYIDHKVKEIAHAGAANNESHLMVLASLMLADEVFDLRQEVSSVASEIKGNKGDETAIVRTIEQLAERIDTIAGRIQKV